MSFQNNQPNPSTAHELNEPVANYEKAELDLLRDGIRRTHEERFLFTTMLYKVQQTMKRAIIMHKPDHLTKSK